MIEPKIVELDFFFPEMNSSAEILFFACYDSPFDDINGNLHTVDTIRVQLSAKMAIEVLRLLVSMRPEEKELQRWLKYGKKQTAFIEKTNKKD